jgi:hypothetical protein
VVNKHIRKIKPKTFWGREVGFLGETRLLGVRFIYAHLLIAKYFAFIVRSFVVLSTALSGKVKAHPLHGDSQSLIPAKLVMGLSY